jgi:Dolichyl-phosphate-mannose-protein mannosyltransferase
MSDHDRSLPSGWRANVDFAGATTPSLSAHLIGRVTRADPLVAIALAAMLLGIIFRVTFGAGLPLWVDETFTAAFAAQKSLGDLVYHILQDVNAPLYYVVAYGGAQVFGISNEALRLPAFVFGCLAPLLCLLPAGGIPRETRLVWCALIALWGPGLAASQVARCYSLLLFLSIATTVFFVKLIDRPSRRNAALWAVFGGLAILTHYYALMLVALQGIAYLAVYRARALRTWPAGLVFVPVFVWLLVHAQRIAEFARSDIAWYWDMDFAHLVNMIGFVTGHVIVFQGLVALALLGLVVRSRMAAGCVNVDSPGLGTRCAIAIAALGIALVIALAIWRPLVTSRYLVPFVPGILLGMALAPRCLGAASRMGAGMLVALFAAGAIITPALDKTYNFELASDELMAAGAKHVVFFWDHPANPIEDPLQLEIVGGFFFKRHGAPIDVTPFKSTEPADPNPRLLELAQRPDSAILWIYHTSVASTRANSFPPRISELDPSFRCRDFGRSTVKVLACSRPAQ